MIFYYPYFSPDVIVNLARRTRGHFVTLIKVGYIELGAFLNFLISHGRQPEVKGLLFIKHAFHFARCLSFGRPSLIRMSGTKPTLQ